MTAASRDPGDISMDGVTMCVPCDPQSPGWAESHGEARELRESITGAAMPDDVAAMMLTVDLDRTGPITVHKWAFPYVDDETGAQRYRWLVTQP